MSTTETASIAIAVTFVLDFVKRKDDKEEEEEQDLYKRLPKIE
jgi:hypothetical protein